jgi:hypothetical protein
MTQEEKQLLIKDLCARLLYGVKFESYDNIPIVEYCVCDNIFIHEQGYVIIELLDKDSNGNTLASTSINLTTVSRLPKPYLRPMSSMTEEDRQEYDSKRKHICDDYNRYCFDSIESIDWLNAHHFDYRGLIEKGLAIEAPEDMYKTE